jgi:hypothetical protein
VTGLNLYGGSGGNTFTVTGTSNFYTDTGLSTGTGNDTVNVEATTGALGIDNPGGQDSVYVGSNGSALAGNVQGIHGGVTGFGAGATALTVDDGGHTTGRTATLSNSPFFGTFLGAISGLAPAAIAWIPTSGTTGGVTGLNVYGGSGGNAFTVTGTSNFYNDTYLQTGAGNDAVNITATTGGLHVYNSGGTDSVVVGSLAPATTGGTLAAIHGVVYAFGPGWTNLTIDDSGDTLARTVTVTKAAVTGLGNPAPIEYHFGVSSLTINGSKGASTYTVPSTQGGTATTLNAGPANEPRVRAWQSACCSLPCYRPAYWVRSSWPRARKRSSIGIRFASSRFPAASRIVDRWTPIGSTPAGPVCSREGLVFGSYYSQPFPGAPQGPHRPAALIGCSLSRESSRFEYCRPGIEGSNNCERHAPSGRRQAFHQRIGRGCSTAEGNLGQHLRQTKRRDPGFKR